MKTFKGTLHPEMKILSSFTHPQVVANLNEFFSSAEHKGRYFEECLEPSSCLAPLTSIAFYFSTMQVNGKFSLSLVQIMFYIYCRLHLNLHLLSIYYKTTITQWMQYSTNACTIQCFKCRIKVPVKAIKKNKNKF